MSRVALITGGQQGIGLGIARALRDAGYALALAAEQPPDAPAVRAALADLGPGARYFRHDVQDVAGVAALLDQVEASFGPVTTLVSNAGVPARVRGDLLDVTPDSFDFVLGVNLRGGFFLAQAVAARMLGHPANPYRAGQSGEGKSPPRVATLAQDGDAPARGGRGTRPPGGRAGASPSLRDGGENQETARTGDKSESRGVHPIALPYRALIFITSVSAEMATASRAEYCISKAGAAMMAKLFALRLAPLGIGVFEVRPGIIETAMTAGVAAHYAARIAEGLVPAARWGQPFDIGSVVVPLAQGQFAFATGAVIAVDGGLSIARL